MNSRKIKITSKLAKNLFDIFTYFSVQLSDGYWENSGGDFGSYEDEYYPDIWNCFDFREAKNTFTITLKSKPTWPDAKEDCAKLHKLTDQEILDYLGTAIIDSIDDYPDAFDKYDDEYLNSLIEVIKTWSPKTKKIPKMTHAEIAKILGHDFEYIE